MEKLFFSISCLLCSVIPTPAQLSEAGKWAVEAHKKYRFIEPNITYVKAGGVDLKLDVYRPKVKNPKLFATLIFIQGSWRRAGTEESYSLRVLSWIEKSWNVVNGESR